MLWMLLITVKSWSSMRLLSTWTLKVRDFGLELEGQGALVSGLVMNEDTRG